jgi:flagellar hook-associated protein 3 FlgL
MRISTAGIHNSALGQMMAKSSALAKTQNQIAAGTRILTPADDPIGAAQALELDRALAESQQHQKNTTAATNRLSFEEQTLGDVTSLLGRIRDLSVEANNPTLDDGARKSILSEVQVRFEDLVDLANRKDTNGEYLFAGYSTLTQPFVRSGNTVSYQGDDGTRVLQTGPSQRVTDGHPGSAVFMNIPQGNGTFLTSAESTNTGAATIDVGTVTNATAWGTGGSFTIHFTTPTDYEVLDAVSGTQLSTGTYSPNGTGITFNGVQVTIQGAAATGDQFNVDPGGSEDMFTAVNNLITTLKRPSSSTAQNALFATEMGQALKQLDNSLDRISDVRSEVGARLAVLSDSTDDQADRQLDLKTQLSQIRDLDYADAITTLNIQLAGLQAAQQSYAKISGLNLFNYLR